PRPLPSAAVAAPLRLVAGPVAKIDEGAQVGVRLQNDVASPAPVPAVGAAPGHVLFPPKAHGTVTAVAGFHKDSGFIQEHPRPPAPSVRAARSKYAKSPAPFRRAQGSSGSSPTACPWP